MDFTRTTRRRSEIVRFPLASRNAPVQVEESLQRRSVEWKHFVVPLSSQSEDRDP